MSLETVQTDPEGYLANREVAFGIGLYSFE